MYRLRTRSYSSRSESAQGSPCGAHPEHGGSSPPTYAATSDSDGHFTIKDVAPGRYNFFATRTGYVDQPYQSNGTDSGAVLALQPGQQLTDVLFRLTMAAVITGHVNNEDGEALARVGVMALRRPSEEEMVDGGKKSMVGFIKHYRVGYVSVRQRPLGNELASL